MHELRAHDVHDVLEQQPVNEPRNVNSCLNSDDRSNAAFWEEATMVEPRDQALSTVRNIEPKEDKTQKSVSMKNKKNEPVACQFPGCTRRFINQAELTNHMEVLHSPSWNDVAEEGIHSSSLAIEANHAVDLPDLAENDVDHTIKPSMVIDGDQTIKAIPMPVTAQSLQILNSASTKDLARSMDNLSLTESDEQGYAASMFSFDTTYSVLDDCEDTPTSEIADQDSPRIQLPVRMLLCLWMRMIFDFSRRFSKAGDSQRAPYPGSEGQHSSASQSRESLGTASYASSQHSAARSIKRRRSPDDGDDGNERKNNKTRKNPGNTTSDQNKPLACPFNKHDNYTFGGDSSNRDYYVCSTWNDVKTAYFKQHLLRTHCMPAHHCDRCGDDCKNQTNLRAHLRMNPPCDLKELDKDKIMPEIQDELGLRSRNTVGMDRTQYWEKVYDTIFPGERHQKERLGRPIDPYYKGPSHEVIQRFLHFSELRLPDIIRRSRSELHLDEETYNENDTQLTRQILQEASQIVMTELRSTQPVNLRDLQQRNDTRSQPVAQREPEVRVKDETSRAGNQPRTVGRDQLQEWNAPSDSTERTRGTSQQQQTMPGQLFNLPTRSSVPVGNTMPSLISEHLYQQQPPNFAYSTYVPEDFDYNRFLQEPEFDNTIETLDMYGSSTLNAHDLEEYHYVDNPPDATRRERRSA